MPRDWKSLADIGPGVCGIRIRTGEGGSVEHRVTYVARFPEAICVLHAFAKKTRQTPRYQLELAAARDSQLLRGRYGKTR